MRILYIIVPAIIIFIVLRINIPRPIATFNYATCKLNVYNKEEKLTRLRVKYLSDDLKNSAGEIDKRIEETEIDVCQLLNQNYDPIQLDDIVYISISVDSKKTSGFFFMKDELMGKDSLVQIFQMRY
ncbi:hypothetical protein [Aureispira anguillae]|uniref:Uncharacterized protein n=1 Tax=Aureispira anguillae TaxID=2864201 RepID=A0A915YHF2_9BACT|nr:hypothetical protein [Aureispira anguillae]BDS13036.1 hypothetical protein AsAng_0037640 [Aureispira anguillae]